MDWGLGEVVVDGRVIPDRYRLSLSGAVIEVTSGRKDVALRPRPGGGILEQPVKAEASSGDAPPTDSSSNSTCWPSTARPCSATAKMSSGRSRARYSTCSKSAR